MKKLFKVLILVVIFSFSVVGISAINNTKSVDSIITEIRKDQGISENELIDVDEVNDLLLVELGESLIQEYFQDEDTVQAFIEYYGGEGSDDLDQAYLLIGDRYLNGYPIMMGLMRSYNNQYDTTDDYQWSRNQRRGMMSQYYDSNYSNSNDRYDWDSSQRRGMMYRYNSSSIDQYDNRFDQSYRSVGMMSSFRIVRPIFGFVGFGLIIGLIVFLFSRNNKHRSYTEDVVNILKERYARGEISHDEYIQTLNVLKK